MHPSTKAWPLLQYLCLVVHKHSLLPQSGTVRRNNYYSSSWILLLACTPINCKNFPKINQIISLQKPLAKFLDIPYLAYYSNQTWPSLKPKTKCRHHGLQHRFQERFVDFVSVTCRTALKNCPQSHYQADFWLQSSYLRYYRVLSIYCNGEIPVTILQH